MSSVFTSTNAWISEHQALVVAFGIPFLTALSAGLVSYLTNKANLVAQRRDRALQRELKLADFRQAWIDELRRDLATFGQLEVSAWVGDRTEKIAKMAETGGRILMRMNRDDPDYETIETLMRRGLDAFVDDPEEKEKLDKQYEDCDPTVVVGQRILKREWERLKSDLRSTER